VATSLNHGGKLDYRHLNVTRKAERERKPGRGLEKKVLGKKEKEILYCLDPKKELKL